MENGISVKAVFCCWKIMKLCLQLPGNKHWYIYHMTDGVDGFAEYQVLYRFVSVAAYDEQVALMFLDDPRYLAGAVPEAQHANGIIAFRLQH
jgi:hypothetical protein